MQPCPVSYHTHDCDCRRDQNGKWIVDPACKLKDTRLKKS